MKTFISFIFIGAIIGLGILVGRGAPRPVSPADQASGNPVETAQTSEQAVTEASTEATNTVAQGSSAPNGRLFYLTETDGNLEIHAIDVVSKEKKLIYSDKEKSETLKLVSRVTRSGDSILAVIGQGNDNAGKLTAITTDGSAKTSTLIPDFAVAAAPVVSPDQSKLAITSFSSSEANFGFTLSLLGIDGKNKNDLVTDEKGIAQPVFSPDGKQVAFIRGGSTEANELAIYDLGTGKQSTLHRKNDLVIQDFDWSPVGLITFTAGPVNRTNQGELDTYLLDPRNNDVATLTKTDKAERHAIIAPDASGITYIQAAANKYNPNNPAMIVVAETTGKNPTELGQAIELLGWIK